MNRKGFTLLMIFMFTFIPILSNAQANTNETKDFSKHPKTSKEESKHKSLKEDSRSALYPENWYPGYQDDEGRFLHDFSYAGYQKGEKPIPTDVPGQIIDVTKAPYSADNTGEKDATKAIQQAIDKVGEEGGGVVYLPSGTYKVKPQENKNYALRISNNGVVLRGAGKDRTFLYNEETVMRGKQIISVRGDGYTWTQYEENTSFISSDLLEPTSQIPVDDISPYKIGDWVVISTEVTEDFIEEHDMSGWWDSLLDTEGTRFYRQITNIDKENKYLTIDAPTRYPLKIRDRAKIYKVDTPLSEIGIEDLSIGNKQHSGSGFGDGDYKEVGTGGYDVHASKVIHFEQIVNSWVKRVNTYQPEENKDNFHILSNGIVLTQTRNVSIVESNFSNPQYRGGGGNGYLFELLGNDNLIQDTHANKGRHNFSFKNMQANGNVIHRSTSTDPSLLTDFHMRLSMSNLLDSLVMNNDSIHAGVRSSDNHGMTTSQSVIWNTTGNGSHPTTSYLIESRQFGNGYVIGTNGSSVEVKTTPTVVSGRETSPEDFVEGEGQGGFLEPQSLYENQLNRRLKRETAQASGIFVNGKPLRHFLLGKLEYHVELPYGTKKNDIPSVTVQTMNDQATVEIIDPETLPGTTEVKVTDNNGTVQHYQLHFTVASEPAELAEIYFMPDKSRTGWKAKGNKIESGSKAHFRLFGTMSNGLPVDFSTAEVAYSSNNEEIATINSDGVITAVNEGETTLTVSVTLDDVTVTANVDVIVVPRFLEPDLPSLAITKVTASEHDGNVPENTIDGDIDTRWSAEGEGQWIMYDLGEVHNIAAVSIDFHNGDKRSTIFNLEVSDNGDDWSNIYDGQSSGETLGFERFEFDPVDARYVRFVGFGNTINAWNSLTEFRIHPLVDETISISTILNILNDYSEEITPEAFRALELHLKAVEHFETQEEKEKIVKHMESFKLLLDKQKDQNLISGEAYDILTTNTDSLIRKWLH